MTPDDFDYISGLLRNLSGLVLTQEKAYLLESRLMPVARKNSLQSVDELIALVRLTKKDELITEIMEAMTTNESFFFRDTKPFDLFRDDILPDLIERRGTTKAFRIWCAAASSGQEPYSLAIILKEAAARLAGWRHEIVGTDISKDILAKASAGIYSQFEVQRGLPIQFLIKYFDKMEDQWQIKPDIRNMVTYKYFNLLDNLTPLGRFDIVFCRNVLIYFDAETKGKVLSCIADLMPEDGLLFLGGAETVLGISERFRPVKGKRGVYEKVS
ncbi:MAG: protein-glutamate O-methyltransferase CheR [Rhodospirillales bacterium]|jgi:chemotaxis protein methyltransferase CheR|nr:protein-glutamate O-methyltransferase CheR [Rhodospirillales bacterium]MBT4626208.1 protein-glutamate O-methyltransferase CheR [Rhodospirillales bacterium]MBT5353240.1 protein-glutamate O-methyltransferase CheR [Rhodospirillales bacterium]MBT6108904.1 protein-glutamate O-methyltransferase CheR [Rhodospirillales bacterium]